MLTDTDNAAEGLTIEVLRKKLSPYARPDRRMAIVQLINTLGPYIILWAVLIYMVEQRYPAIVIIPLIIIAGLLLVRIFILFHDCAHNAFFASRRTNTVLGYICGILTFTPFDEWRHNHLAHHGTYADLDHRGVGDIWTLTVDEYRAVSRMKRLGYRLYRSPPVFLGIGPGYFFLIAQRFMHLWKGQGERYSIWITNLSILSIVWIFSVTVGLKTYLIIQIPVMLIAGAVGVWLFYVQHQFEGVYWSRHKDWDPVKAALKGSSYYKLPRVLQWFSGNIGLHHIHHVLPRIPNYRLQKCYDECPPMRDVSPLTLRGSMKSLWLNLWDEKEQRLVSFNAL